MHELNGFSEFFSTNRANHNQGGLITVVKDATLEAITKQLQDPTPLEDLLEAAAVPSLCLIIIASFFILITSKYILRESDE